MIRLDPNGFLEDPRGPFSANPDLQTFDATATASRCVVVLGEPGIGKTSALASWFRSAQNTDAPGRDHRYLNLSGRTEEQVRRQLASESVQRWKNGENTMLAVLDSLDEAAGLGVSRVLADELAEWPLDRLCLVLACRTGDWPSSLELDLRTRFSDEGVTVYELAPLSYGDIVTAARLALSEPTSFLHEIHQLGLGSIASKPLTLVHFLLAPFVREGRLPATQREAFEKGVLFLADEPSRSRDEAGQLHLRRRLEARERVAIAGRVAAVLALANRSSVWDGPWDGSVNPTDVTRADLSGGTERTGGETVQVREDGLREVLRTGLFTLRGRHRFGLWHQAGEDFLAAWHLHNRGLTADQVMALLVHPGDPTGRIAPRLHGVAAWAGVLIPGVLQRLAKTDPEVVIESAVHITDSAARSELVETVLNLFESEDLAFTIFGPSYRLHRLAHPSLADQLRPWVVRTGDGGPGREAAFRIAVACRTQTLADAALAIALDAEEPEHIRIEAIKAAGALLPTGERSRLRPLVLLSPAEDPEDRLKRFALPHLFPGSLSLSETLQVLSPPQSEVSSRYKTFIAQELPERIAQDEIALALRWLAAGDGGLLDIPAFDRLADELIRRALEQLDDDELLDAVARVARLKLDRDKRIVARRFLGEESDPFDHVERRRRLLGALVRLDLKDVELHQLCFSHQTVARPDDVPWLAEQAADDPTHARVWARLTSDLFDARSAFHTSAVIDACSRSPDLAARFAGLLGSVELDSEEANRLRHVVEEDARQRAEWRAERERRQVVKHLPPVEPALIEAEAADPHDTAEPDAFARLVYRLSFPGRRPPPLELEVTALPGWADGTEERRRRILSCARRYLLARQPSLPPWTPEGGTWWSSITGYMALRLMAESDPEWLPQQDGEFWKRWSPSLVAIEVFVAHGQRRLDLLHEARRKAPAALADALFRSIEEEVSRSGRAWGADILRELIDERSTTGLMALLTRRDLPALAYADLLEPLLAAGAAAAYEQAVAALGARPRRSAIGRRKADTAARALLAHAPEAAWPSLWRVIRTDANLGAELLTDSHHDSSAMRALRELSSAQLAELYLWLASRCATELAVPRERIHSSSLENLEARIPELLAERATADAVTALERLSASYPSRGWLRPLVRRARTRSLDQTWVAATPHEVLALNGPAGTRFVRTDAQLAAVVVESLERLQARLRGPNAVNFALWDRRSKEWKPKEEERLSDFIADHLRMDLKTRGLIIHREVEIHARQVGDPGEIPDLVVSATVRNVDDETGSDPLSVIVEVKGSYHPKVLNSMRAQLVDRYLETSESTAGVYCVGWFGHDFAPMVGPPGERRRMTFEELADALAAQARQLTRAGRSISSYLLDASLR